MDNNRTRLFSRDYILVMMAAVGTSFVIYFFLSTLPLFAETLTGSIAFAGFLSLSTSITALVTRPVFGMLSDKYGRVAILVAGAAISAVACVLFSFTTSLVVYSLTAGLVMLVAIRVIHGIGFSMNQTSAGAAIPDIVPKERLAEGVGIFGIIWTMGQAGGPLIALTIVGNGELSRFNILFFLSAGLCAFSTIAGCMIKYERGAKHKEKEVPKQPEVKEESSTPEVKTIFGFEKQLLGPALVTILYFFSIASILSFLTLYGRSRGFRVEHLGWFFFASAGGVLIARLMFGRIVDRRGFDIVMIPGFITLALSLFAIPFAPSVIYVILLGFPYGLATGAIGPPVNTMMFKRTSPKRRGSASAAFNMSGDLGITLGAPTMGLIADYIRFDWVYWFAAALAIVGLLIYVLFVSDKRYNKKFSSPDHLT